MRTAFRIKVLRQVFCQTRGVGYSKLEIKYKQDFALKIHMMVTFPLYYNGSFTGQWMNS